MAEEWVAAAAVREQARTAAVMDLVEVVEAGEGVVVGEMDGAALGCIPCK